MSPISLLNALARKQRAAPTTKSPFPIPAGAQHAEPEKEPAETEGRRERISTARHINHRRALHRMQQPDERRQESDPEAPRGFHFAPAKKFLREIEQRDRRRRMPENADEMIPHRRNKEGGVIERVARPLQRPVKIGSRRVREQKVLKPLPDQAPTANERIAQNERLVVPDKAVAQGRRIGCQRGGEQKKRRDRLASGEPTIRLDGTAACVNWAMSRAVRGCFCPALLLLLASSARAAGVPPDCEQLIVGLAPNWDSMRGVLQRFERAG